MPLLQPHPKIIIFYNSIWSNLYATREEYDQLISNYYLSIHDRVQPILDELASDDSYLQIEVVVLVLNRLLDRKEFTVNASDRFMAILDVSSKAGMIRGDITPERYQELLAYGEQINYPDMKAVYMDKLMANSRLAEGKPAIEVELRDIDGKTMKLSDLANKPMYIDIWATWCGPCLAEAPYFKALSVEYPGIHFVSVSVDGDTGAWESSVRQKDDSPITEVLATNDMRKNWDIVGIPRFLLIDADFNIISADAPRPSQRGEIKAILDKLTQK